MDLDEMLEGWRWRHARHAELAALVAVAIANRLPADEAMKVDDLVSLLANKARAAE